MKNVFLLVLLVVFSCAKDKSQNMGLPECVQAKIETIKNQPVENPPKEVWKWEVDGNTYYYFSAACCDQFSELFDSNCNLICHPDGGFTGVGDGNCPSFTGPINKTLIWKDPR